MTVGQAIKAAIQGAFPKRTIDSVAADLGLTRSVLSNVITGRTKADEGLVREIRTLLGMPKEWPYAQIGKASGLAEPSAVYTAQDSIPQAARGILQGSMILIKQWTGVLAGSPYDECQFIEEDVPMAVVSTFIEGDPALYDALRIAGDSMLPLIEQGEVVIVKRSGTPPVGSIVVAQSPNNVTLLKVLRRGQNGRQELHSLNSQYKPITDLNGWRLVAYAIAIIGEIDRANPSRRNLAWDNGRALRA